MKACEIVISQKQETIQTDLLNEHNILNGQLTDLNILPQFTPMSQFTHLILLLFIFFDLQIIENEKRIFYANNLLSFKRN